MPTLQQIADEIQSGPLTAELAPLVTANDWNGVSDVLRRADRSGYIPPRWVLVSLVKFPALDAVVSWAMDTRQLPDGTPLSGAAFPVYVLLHNLHRIEQSVEHGDIRADVASVQAGLTQADVAGLVGDAGQPIPTAFGPFLMSGEVKISRAQEAWGYDASAPTGEECRLALA